MATTSLATGLGLSTSGTASLVGSSQLTVSVATSSLFTGTTGQLAYFSGTNALAGTSTLFIGTNSYLGVGTTTSQWPVQIAHATRPQLTLSDSSRLTSNHWSFSNSNGVLNIATSSNTTFATSSASALSINTNGALTVSNSITSNSTITSGSSFRAADTGYVFSSNTTMGMAYNIATDRLSITSSNGDIFLSGGATTMQISTDVVTFTGSPDLTGLLSATAGTFTATTQVVSPLVAGGTLAGSTLNLRSTTGAGTTDAIVFQVGSNGATEAGRITTAGRWGIGTTTPWGLFSLVSNTSPQLVIATSTGYNPLFMVSATTTGESDWARVAIGTTTASGLGSNWPFTVQGEIYSTKRSILCDNPSVVQNATADSTQGVCGGMMFDEDSQGATGGGTLPTYSMQLQALQMWVGLTAAPTAAAALGDGAAITMGGSLNQGWAWASSSPAFEALVSASSTNASSTIIMVGLQNKGIASDWGTIAANGYFFTASSSASTGNWWAVAGESAATMKFVDTGIASTSAPSVTTPVFQRMRIRVIPDNATANGATGQFFIDDVLVASIAVTGTQNGMQPAVSIGKTNNGLASLMYVSYIRAWADLLPGQRN